MRRFARVARAEWGEQNLVNEQAKYGTAFANRSKWLARLDFIALWFLLKYLLDADSDPQITQITQIFRKLA